MAALRLVPVPPRHETFRHLTTPRYHAPPFLAAAGHSTVSTSNTKVTLYVDLSVARNTLRLSTRHWAQFFAGRPGPGFSRPAIVPNITRRVSHSLCVRCDVFYYRGSEALDCKKHHRAVNFFTTLKPNVEAHVPDIGVISCQLKISRYT